MKTRLIKIRKFWVQAMTQGQANTNIFMFFPSHPKPMPGRLFK